MSRRDRAMLIDIVEDAVKHERLSILADLQRTLRTLERCISWGRHAKEADRVGHHAKARYLRGLAETSFARLRESAP